MKDVPLTVVTRQERADHWPVQVFPGPSEDLAGSIVPAALQAIKQHRRPTAHLPRAFISYARLDGQRVHRVLVNAFKGQYWLDGMFLSPGVAWAPEIEAAIEHADIFVFFVTSSLRDDSFCWSELQHAVTTNKKLLVIPAGVQIPDRFRDRAFPNKTFAFRRRIRADQLGSVEFLIDEARKTIVITNPSLTEREDWNWIACIDLIEQCCTHSGKVWDNVVRSDEPEWVAERGPDGVITLRMLRRPTLGERVADRLRVWMGKWPTHSG